MVRKHTRTATGSARRTAALAVGFVGGGNMATALIRGLLGGGLCRPEQIGASENLSTSQTNSHHAQTT